MNTPVIVGAGTSGMSLAYYLRWQGLHPVILESHGAPGSSWRVRIFGMRHRLVGNIRARVLEARQLAATIAHQGR